MIINGSEVNFYNVGSWSVKELRKFYNTLNNRKKLTTEETTLKKLLEIEIARWTKVKNINMEADRKCNKIIRSIEHS